MKTTTGWEKGILQLQWMHHEAGEASNMTSWLCFSDNGSYSPVLESSPVKYRHTLHRLAVNILTVFNPAAS